jgi:hypothetical protein
MKHHKEIYIKPFNNMLTETDYLHELDVEVKLLTVHSTTSSCKNKINFFDNVYTKSQLSHHTISSRYRIHNKGRTVRLVGTIERVSKTNWKDPRQPSNYRRKRSWTGCSS